MKKLMITAAVCLCVCAGMLLNNCGYKLSGFGNQVPDHVKTILIPDFENKTTRFQVEQYITYSVREEFIKRSNLELVDTQSRADSLLEGTILRFDVAPISYGEDASANLYRVTITVNVRLIDLKTDELIFEGEGISYSESYEFNSYGGDLTELDAADDFFSQETDTIIKIAEEFAASLVTTILENF